MNASWLVTAGIALIMTGFIIVFIGLMASSKNAETQVSGAGVIFLGPIPLIFGTDRRSAVIVSALGLALMLAAYAMLKK
ncbi:MAG: DUF131 domain-containing protein [Candidatus Altiarchaeota archaeon]